MLRRTFPSEHPLEGPVLERPRPRVGTLLVKNVVVRRPLVTRGEHGLPGSTRCPDGSRQLLLHRARRDFFHLTDDQLHDSQVVWKLRESVRVNLSHRQRQETVPELVQASDDCASNDRTALARDVKFLPRSSLHVSMKFGMLALWWSVFVISGRMDAMTARAKSALVTMEPG